MSGMRSGSNVGRSGLRAAAVLALLLGACGEPEREPLQVPGHLFLGDAEEAARLEGAAVDLAQPGMRADTRELALWRFQGATNIRHEGDLLVFELEQRGEVVSPADWSVDASLVEELLLRIDTGAKHTYSRVRLTWKNERGEVGRKVVGAPVQGLQTFAVDLRGELAWDGTITELRIAPRVGKDGWTVRLAPLELRGQLVDLARLGAGRSEIRLGRVYQTGFFHTLPGDVRFDVEFPADPRLFLDTGVVGAGAEAPRSGGPESGRARLRVRAIVAGREHVLDEFERDAASGWQPRAIDLSAVAGLRGELVLSAEALGDGAVLACWGEPVLRAGDAPRKTNAFLYLADTLRADHLPAYGYARSSTPHLDRLAAEGLLFENCIAQGNRTNVSMPSIFTSTYPSQHGVPHLRRKAPADLPTLAETLRAAGYRTASFYTNRIVGHARGLGRGFSELHDFTARYRGEPARVGVLPEPVFEWVERHRDEPVFVYVHTLEPHHPYIPQERFQVPSDYAGPLTWETFRDAKTPDEVDYVRTLYDSEIQFMDHSLGRFVQHLETLELFDQALFVFTSDHGEQFLEHGGWLHGKGLFDHQVHVPLIVRLPGARDAGTRVERVVESVDVMPTMLRVLGLPVPPTAAGADLLATPATGGAPPVARSEDLELQGGLSVAVRSGRWKAVRAVEDGIVHERLFDLETDPFEQAPLDPDGDLAPEARAVLAALDDVPRAVTNQAGEDEEALDSRDLDQLRELGYIE